MQKTMSEITLEIIYSNDYGNYVKLTQPVPYNHEDATILITIDQIDILIKWLTEAKHELSNNGDE